MTNLTSEIDDAYLQNSVELIALNIAPSSFTSQPTHIQSRSPTTSIIPAPSFILQHKVTQIPPLPFTPSTSPTTSTFQLHSSGPPPPPIMAAKYAPLVLPSPLANMPQDYQSKITLLDGTDPLSAQCYGDKMNDCFDLQEVDEESVKLIMFARI